MPAYLPYTHRCLVWYQNQSQNCSNLYKVSRYLHHYSSSLTFQGIWRRAHMPCLCKPCRPSVCSQFLLRWPIKQNESEGAERGDELRGPSVHVRCRRSWGRRGRACTTSSRPQPPSSSHRERCPGEAGCSTQNLHKPGNGWKSFAWAPNIYTNRRRNLKEKNRRETNIKGGARGGNVFTAANAKQVLHNNFVESLQ